VNVIKISKEGRLRGYNSDFFGFKESLLKFIPENHQGMNALVLGSGGSSKAVRAVLDDLNIPFRVVSRRDEKGYLLYEQLDIKIIEEHKLIINTSPVGMYPNLKDSPRISYASLTADHYLFDLIYNPLETLFMVKGKARGSRTKNGMEMLYLQAEKAWQIWNEK
jgi:shikimate dehydrogenase